MNSTKKNATILRILIFIALFVIVVSQLRSFAYNFYFRIDTSQLNYGSTAGFSESPDEQHTISLVAYRVEDVVFIQGTINIAADGRPFGRWAGGEPGPRTIFWQRVKADSIRIEPLDESYLYYDLKFGRFDGMSEDEIIWLTASKWVDIEWIDSHTVNINGIDVNINKGYDYRRNSFLFRVITWPRRMNAYIPFYK